MFRTNIMMIHATSFIYSQLNYFLGTWGKPDLTQHDMVSMPDNIFNSIPHFLKLNTELMQHFGCNTLPLAHEAEQQMFCPNIIVLKALSFFLRKAEDPPCSFGKLIKSIPFVHLRSPSLA